MRELWKRNLLLLFVFLLCFLCVFSCSRINDKDLLDEINGEIGIAFSNWDREGMLNSARKITDSHINGQYGKIFLNNKLYALTYCGEYEAAYKEIIKGLNIFDGDFYHDLLYAEGLLAMKLNIPSDSLERVYAIVQEKYNNERDDNSIVLKYSLQILLYDDTSLLDFDLDTMGEDMKEFMEYMSTLSRDELLMGGAHLGFIFLKPWL